MRLAQEKNERRPQARPPESQLRQEQGTNLSQGKQKTLTRAWCCVCRPPLQPQEQDGGKTARLAIRRAQAGLVEGEELGGTGIGS